jgi:hypothetical protein
MALGAATLPDGTYPPLSTLKPVAEDVWLVDGPLIHFGSPLLKFPFPTRMTLVRLSGGEVFVHSPTELSPALRDQVEHLGTPRWIVAPSRIHYWWIPQWHTAFPNAEIYVAPRVRTQAGARIDFPCTALDRDGGLPWSGEIDTLLVAGRYLTEAEFFHRPTRTLILTDLIENFEPSKLNWPQRLLARLGGILAPDGSMPRDMRLTFSRQVLKDAVEKMLAWNPERVIFAHGRWFDRDGAQELRRAFRWLLD